MKEFYSMTIDQALSETQSNKKGLSEKEARGRLSLSADKHILPQKGKSMFEKTGRAVQGSYDHHFAGGIHNFYCHWDC